MLDLGGTGSLRCLAGLRVEPAFTHGWEGEGAEFERGGCHPSAFEEEISNGLRVTSGVVRLGTGPEIDADKQRRKLMTEQIGGDEIGRNRASEPVPVATDAERAGEGVFEVGFDGEQCDDMEHGDSFRWVIGAEAHDGRRA